MPLPDWTTYASLISGGLGAVTGGLSLWRTSKWKKRDLRIELRKLASDADQDLAHLAALLPRANRSRVNIRAAEGTVRSGAMAAWAEQIERDTARAAELHGELSYPGKYELLSSARLEAEVVRVHRLRSEALRLIAAYEADMAADARDVDRRRTIMESRFPKP